LVNCRERRSARTPRHPTDGRAVQRGRELHGLILGNRLRRRGNGEAGAINAHGKTCADADVALTGRYGSRSRRMCCSHSRTIKRAALPDVDFQLTDEEISLLELSPNVPLA